MNRKKYRFLFLGIFSCLAVQAQNVADSIYRNYLYDTRTSKYFEQLPIKKGAFIFWGDSITHWGDWAELTGYAKALNRGIAGDNTYGLLNRVDEVVRHRPKKLFILIGTNDINVHIALSSSLDNYQKIIKYVQLRSPETAIYVQSVLPVNNQLIGRQYYTGTNEMIQKMNLSLDSLARKNKILYVDLYSHFLDHSAQMDAKYTYDGLHLSGLGYLNWIAVLKNKKLL